MSLNYELRRENHAIREFIASLHFFQPVGAATLSEAAEALRKLAQQLDLPAPVPMQIFQVTIGPQAQGFPASAAAGSGLGFQRFSKEGEVAESIACDANSITYILRDYTLWEELAPKLIELLSELASKYVREVPAIESVRLQYVNEFRSTSKDLRSASELFKEGSRWVAPLGYEGEEAWHSHVGLYIPRDANERHLVNVNCDVTSTMVPPRNESRTLAKILILAGCFFNVPGGKPLIVPSDKLSTVLGEKLTEAHTLEKDVLRQVISDPYLEAMGAKA